MHRLARRPAQAAMDANTCTRKQATASQRHRRTPDVAGLLQGKQEARVLAPGGMQVAAARCLGFPHALCTPPQMREAYALCAAVSSA